MRCRRVVLAIAIALFVPACASTTAGETSGPSAAVGASGAAGADVAGAVPLLPIPAAEPAQVSAGSAGSAGSPGTIADAVLGHEELIAACMATGGFDYVAVVPAHAVIEQAVAEALAGGGDPQAAADAVAVPPDPNLEIVASLTPAERDQYELTLTYCFDDTYEAAWGVDLDDIQAEVLGRVDDLEDRIGADPAVVAARAELLRCMGEQGFAFDSVEDLTQHHMRRSAEVVREIEDAGSDVIEVDNPIWVAFEDEMARFEQAREPCAAAHDAVVVPIENQAMRDG